jgi:5-methylthioadenosine/S-adenosylhomocysteine deaminase
VKTTTAVEPRPALGRDSTMLIRHAAILSMDSEVGDLPRGDVLIEGKRIAAVGPDLGHAAPDEAMDATGCIVVPGFVDTHRHMWQGVIRGYAPQDTLQKNSRSARL